MHDVALLKKLSDKKTFIRLAKHIKQHAVSRETWKVMETMHKYFRSYPSMEVMDIGEFTTFFFTLNKLKEDEHAIYTSYFKKLEEEDADSVLLDDVLKNYITKDYATQIMNAAVNVISDQEGASLDKVSTLLTSFQREVGKTVSLDDMFVPTDLSYTIKACSSSGFTWRLNELNISAGPLRHGDFAILAARPETGKTTFIASEVSYFASQLPDDTRPIVWVNNEESSHKVMARVIQAYFGATKEEIEGKEEELNAEYNDKIGKRIRIINDELNVNDVEQLGVFFEEVYPSLIVIDQLDKVHGYDKEVREDLRIGKLYEWARTLAKKYGPVIAVSQTSDQAENMMYIPQNLLRGSKTDKAGEADLIVTIGKTEADPYKRFINVPKNKLYGGKMSEEIHRHGKFEVCIVPERARYVGVF